MQTLYIGTLSETTALPVRVEGRGIKIYLHRLDANTYILGDDVGGVCLPERPVPAGIGRKAMAGDFSCLMATDADVAALLGRPHFIFAESTIVTETDPSLLRSRGRESNAYPAQQDSR